MSIIVEVNVTFIDVSHMWPFLRERKIEEEGREKKRKRERDT